MGLQAFRLNEAEWYAGNTAIEAIHAAVLLTGVHEDELVDELFFCGVPVKHSIVVVDEETDERKTVGEVLAEMTEPGFVFGIDF